MLGFALAVLGYLYLDRVLAAEVEDSLANATTGITGRRRKPSLEILFFSNSSEAARVARCRRFPPPFGARSKSKASPGTSSLALTVASAAPVGERTRRVVSSRRPTTLLTGRWAVSPASPHCQLPHRRRRRLARPRALASAPASRQHSSPISSRRLATPTSQRRHRRRLSILPASTDSPGATRTGAYPNARQAREYRPEYPPAPHPATPQRRS